MSREVIYISCPRDRNNARVVRCPLKIIVHTTHPVSTIYSRFFYWTTSGQPTIVFFLQLAFHLLRPPLVGMISLSVALSQVSLAETDFRWLEWLMLPSV
jgi:hypothetical protein